MTGNIQLLKFLDEIICSVEYNQWFCGHLHIDKSFPGNVRVLYMGKSFI